MSTHNYELNVRGNRVVVSLDQDSSGRTSVVMQVKGGTVTIEYDFDFTAPTASEEIGDLVENMEEYLDAVLAAAKRAYVEKLIMGLLGGE